RKRRRISKGPHNCARMALDCEVGKSGCWPTDEVMKPHPTSLRVIFAASASNQDRSPYPPPSRPRPPSSRNRGGQIRTHGGRHRMVGCATSKNFADCVLVYFAVNS